MIEGSLLLTGNVGWLGVHVKPPTFAGRWEDREGHYVVLLDLEGADHDVDPSEKVPNAVSSHGGAATVGNEL
jgi:hypothetical protein